MADGATSQGFINYVRTANNQGKFTFSQRTGGSSYVEGLTIANDGATTFAGDVTLTSATANKPVLTLTDTNADAQGPDLVFRKDSASPADGDELFRIYGYGDDDAGNATEGFLALATMTDVSNGSEDSKVQMLTYGGGSQRDTLTLAGSHVGIGTSSPASPLHVKGLGDTYVTLQAAATDGNTAILMQNSGGTQEAFILYDTDDNNLQFGSSSAERARFSSGGFFLVGTTTTNSFGVEIGQAKGVQCSAISAGSIGYSTVASGNHTYFGAKFHNSGGNVVGSITVSNSDTAYGTSSDYRLKENVIALEDGLNRLNQLKPVKFNWKESGKESEGFIAHEVQEVFSDAVTGEKDAVNGEGIIQGQEMDYGRITPLLVKAIQEQQTIIEDLKTRIETLEGE